MARYARFSIPLSHLSAINACRARFCKNKPLGPNCQGCSLQLTGTRGLVGEGGVKGVVDAFG